MIVDCDANATYLPDEDLRRVIAECAPLGGNPSSLHRGGQRARAQLEDARAAVREFLGVDSDDLVVFTSGASEANNTVIRSRAAQRGAQLVVSQVEHPCVLEPLRAAQNVGADVRLVPPNEHGAVPVEQVLQRVTSNTSLVSVMLANNETGVVNPVAEIVEAVRAASPEALIHTDAAQVPGKGIVSFRDLGVDYMTISGHKFGAPPGVGALIIRKGQALEPLILGGPQESKLRGGTENVPGICAMGIALSHIHKDLSARIGTMRGARDTFERLMCERIPGCIINGAGHHRLPNTSSVYIPGVRADDMVVALDLEGFLISAGAACSSGKPEPSHVLRAMQQDEKRLRSTIRVSFRGDVSPLQVEQLVHVLALTAGRMNRSA